MMSCNGALPSSAAVKVAPSTAARTRSVASAAVVSWSPVGLTPTLPRASPLLQSIRPAARAPAIAIAWDRHSSIPGTRAPSEGFGEEAAQATAQGAAVGRRPDRHDEWRVRHGRLLPELVRRTFQWHIHTTTRCFRPSFDVSSDRWTHHHRCPDARTPYERTIHLARHLGRLSATPMGFEPRVR